MLSSIVLLLLGLVWRDDPVSSSVRYNREIVRIFERKCVSCHSEGNLSVPLESYQDVRSWSRAIREEILERRMPPWPAVNGIRPLANDMSLTTRELAIITAWVDGGTPRGDAGDLPPPKLRAAAWPAGEPDLKLQLPAQTVGDDRPDVRRITVSTKLPAERWLRGFDIAPGERRALRSAFLSIKGANGQEQWIGGWTPWHAMKSTPDGVAYRLPARAVLIVELHYKAISSIEPAPSPGGRGLSDRSTLGLYFQSKRPQSVLRDFTINKQLTLGEDLMVWALRPQFTSRGNIVTGSIEVKAIRPNGAIEPLLWVKENGPDWQIPYVLRDPVRLSPGSRLIVSGHAAHEVENPIAVVSVAAYSAISARPALRQPRQ